MTDNLTEAMAELGRDQFVVERCLDEMDFELAAKMIELRTGKPPDVAQLRKTAGKIVLDELKRGRDDGPGSGYIASGYFRATYRHFECLETVELDLIPLKSHGARPKQSYLREVVTYCALFGSGYGLNEQGRLEKPSDQEASN